VSETAPMSVRPLPDDLLERVDLAAPVFADKGLDATRIDELATVTGIPRATLYYYFPGKEHILAHLLSRTLEKISGRLAEAAELSGTGRERLTRVVHAHLAFISDNGPTYRLLSRELGRVAPLVDIAAGVDNAILAPIRGALQDGANDGTLRVSDSSTASSVVHGAVLVVGLQRLVSGSAISIEEQADTLLEMLLTGFAPVESMIEGGR